MIFSSLNILSGTKRVYANANLLTSKRKYFYRKSKNLMSLLISGNHIGVPCWYTSMASPYKALETCVKRFGKQLNNGAPNNRREAWICCTFMNLLGHFFSLLLSFNGFKVFFLFFIFIA